MTREEKQVLFVNELTFEFLEILRNQNDINRNRNEAQPGVVQNTGNQVLTQLSSLTSSLPGASSVITFANLGWNFMKNAKQETRRSTINADVMQNLDTWIHDEVKKAALTLSYCFAEYLETKLELVGIKTFADCVADRMFNYMSKIATEESEAKSTWFVDALLQGAFEGRSGRLKQSYRNTILPTSKSRWQTLLHYHAPTVEGLLTHTSFAMKDERGDWRYYTHTKAAAVPFEKYGLAVFSPEVAKVYLQAVDPRREKYVPFIPEVADTATRLVSMNESVQQLLLPITFTPTQSNTELSENQAQHEVRLEKNDGHIANIQEALKTLTQFMEAFSSLPQNQLRAEIYEEKHWHQFTQGEIHDEETYHLKVENWLITLEQDTHIATSQWLECLVRAALAEYTASQNLTSTLAPWEKTACTLTEEDRQLINTAPTLLPVKNNAASHQVAWESVNLYGYFLSFGLWELYKTAKTRPMGENAQLWQKKIFTGKILLRFLRYWMPQEMEKVLFEDWQIVHEPPGEHLKTNIQACFSHHPSSCPCFYCAHSAAFSQFTTEETKQHKQASVNIDFGQTSQRRWMRKLSPYGNATQQDGHPGFSVKQPDYGTNSYPELMAVNWHWPEQYLSELLWPQVCAELANTHDVSTTRLAALVPAGFNAQIAHIERWHEINTMESKSLEDELAYIKYLLQVLTLADKPSDAHDPGLLHEKSLISTYEDLILVHNACRKRLKIEALADYNQLFNVSSCPADFHKKLNDKIEEYLPTFERHFLALQFGEGLDKFDLPKRYLDPAVEEDAELLKRVEWHNASQYQDPKQPTREEDLKKVQSQWLHTLHQHQNFSTEQPNANAGKTVSQTWQSDIFTTQQMAFLLKVSCQALAMHDILIRNFIYGSGFMQKDRERFIHEERLSMNLLRRVEPEGSHSKTNEIAKSPSDRVTGHEFQPAGSPYEVWVRAKLFHRAYFVAQNKKNYIKSSLYRQGVPYATYEQELNRVLDELPSMESLFKQYPVNTVGTSVLRTELNEWAKALKGQEAEKLKQFNAYREEQERYEQEVLFHEKSQTIIFDTLLSAMPAVIKAAYQDLNESERQGMREAFDNRNRTPLIQWFCTTFYQHRGVLFQTHCLEKCKKHVENAHAIGTYLALPSSEPEENSQAIVPYQTGTLGALHPMQYRNFAEIITQEMRTFSDTSAVWQNLSVEQREAFLQHAYRGDLNAWESFFQAMEGKWYPLTQFTFQCFLAQGLHPDSTAEQTLLNFSMDQIENVKHNRFTRDALELWMERIYYLVDCRAMTPDWGYCLATVKNAHIHATEEKRHIWLHLAAILMICKEIQDNPEATRQLKTALVQIEQALDDVEKKFNKSQASVLHTMLKTWHCSEKVKSNRLLTHSRLRSYIKSIEINISHFYQIFPLLNDLVTAHVSQTFFGDNSRTKQQVQKSYKILENFLEDIGVWEKLQRLHHFTLEDYTKMRANPAKLALISVGRNQVQRVSPLLLQDGKMLQEMSQQTLTVAHDTSNSVSGKKSELEAQTQEIIVNLREQLQEKERVIQEKEQKIQAQAKEIAELKAELTQRDKQQEDAQENESKPSFASDAEYDSKPSFGF